MEMPIVRRKLNLLNHLKSLKNSLANEVFKEQVKNSWPGLAKECNDWCKYLEIPNITTNFVSKDDIDHAIKRKLEKELKAKMSKLSKLKENIYDSFERKDYISNKNVHGVICRLHTLICIGDRFDISYITCKLLILLKYIFHSAKFFRSVDRNIFHRVIKKF